jgi:uncharacterized protein (TIGR02271 family)
MSDLKDIDWDDVIKKEARGSDDEDLGEVLETGHNYVLVQKGIINKEKFYIPKNMVESYDGSVLRFNIAKDEVKSRFMRDSPSTGNEYSSSYKNMDVTAEEEQDKSNVSQDTAARVPVMEERLNVSKEESTEDATVTKEPVTETKTIEIPVTHEEITIEKRPPRDRKYTSISSENPVESKTEIKIPLKKEEVEVIKQPYVKEEVVVKKNPVTKTQQATEQVRSEKVNIADDKNIEEQQK